jgi:hypothetical protein
MGGRLWIAIRRRVGRGEGIDKFALGDRDKLRSG